MKTTTSLSNDRHIRRRNELWGQSVHYLRIVRAWRHAQRLPRKPDSPCAMSIGGMLSALVSATSLNGSTLQTSRGSGKLFQNRGTVMSDAYRTETREHGSFLFRIEWVYDHDSDPHGTAKMVMDP